MRKTTSSMVAIGFAVIAGGCEIALPLLIAETTKPSETVLEPLPPPSDALAVELQDISGEIDGLALSPPMFTHASGTRFGDLVQVSLLTAEGVSITVEVCDQAQSGGGDPYAGLGGERSGRGLPVDGGGPEAEPMLPPSPCGVGPATLVACGSTCTSAVASDIDALVQTEADARQLELDAALEGGGTVHLALRYGPEI